MLQLVYLSQCNVMEMMAQGDDTKMLHVLLDKYDCLFEEPVELPPFRGQFDHRISLLPKSSPVNQRPYKYPGMKKNIIEKFVNQMIDQGIIQHSTSSYASLVVLVGNKDGSWRLCVDYKELNKQTIKYKFSIPIIEDLLDELGALRCSQR